MKSYFPALLCLFMLVLPAFAQEVKDEIDGKSRVVPYDHLDATFGLDTADAAATTAQDVGFDNRKSSWKFSYELRFLADSKIVAEVQKKVHIKYGYKPDQLVFSSKVNQEIDDEIRKLVRPFAKGKFKRRNLESEDNRLIVAPVKLPPEIEQVLGDASMKNQYPEFIVTIKGEVSTKTATKIKFKEKYFEQFSCWVKIYAADHKTYWALNRCGAMVQLSRKDDKIKVDKIFGL